MRQFVKAHPPQRPVQLDRLWQMLRVGGLLVLGGAALVVYGLYRPEAIELEVFTLSESLAPWMLTLGCGIALTAIVGFVWLRALRFSLLRLFVAVTLVAATIGGWQAARPGRWLQSRLAYHDGAFQLHVQRANTLSSAERTALAHQYDPATGRMTYTSNGLAIGQASDSGHTLARWHAPLVALLPLTILPLVLRWPDDGARRIRPDRTCIHRRLEAALVLGGTLATCGIATLVAVLWITPAFNNTSGPTLTEETQFVWAGWAVEGLLPIGLGLCIGSALTLACCEQWRRLMRSLAGTLVAWGVAVTATSIAVGPKLLNPQIVYRPDANDLALLQHSNPPHTGEFVLRLADVQTLIMAALSIVILPLIWFWPTRVRTMAPSAQQAH